jgi:GH25 family lysozyme M1 (1,4-beta-N-acetylmuramidase)
LNGIDISSYQSGINLSVVPADFVIVKLTEGTGYVNPDCTRAVNQALAAGRLVGGYMYVSGGNAIAEADHFISVARPWLGRITLWVDWESGGNSAWGNMAYLDAVVKRIKAVTGRTVGIYASSGVFPRAVAAANGSPTWVAQYASMTPTGYQSNPWNEGAYQANIRQYSSAGRLNGWGGSLDINKYYGTREQWLAWAGNEDDMALTDDDIMRIWTHKLPNGACVRDCLAPAINDIFEMHDTGMTPGQWLHKLPNGRYARDIVSDATSDVIHMHDSMIPELKAQNTALTAAVEALSKSVGANPDDLSKVVADAVRDKLNKTVITVTAKEQ